MPIASKVNSTIASPVTQQSLHDGIRYAFSSIGVGIYDEFDSGTDKVLIYIIYTDFNYPYGNTFLRIRTTDGLSILCQLFATWDYSTRTGGFGSQEVQYPDLDSNQSISITALGGSTEFSFVLLSQSYYFFVPLGWMVPYTRPSWWDPSNFTYSFIPVDSEFSIWRTTDKQPFNTTDHSSFISDARLSGVNPVTNKRDILQGICLFSTANQGISGRTSDDIVIVAANGASRYDIIRTPDNKEYLLLGLNSGALAVRSA